MTHCPKCKEDIVCPNPPDYVGVKNRLRQRYVKEFDINQQNIKEKIKMRSEESGISEQKIREKLSELDGQMLQWFFVIDPKRQHKDETFAAEYIKNISGVNNFINLPNNGFNTKFVIDGKIVLRKDLSEGVDRDKKPKSIDFEFAYGTYKAYVSHKFTKDSGGGQVDFKREFGTFLPEANNSTSQNTLFLTIGDGKFNEKLSEYWKTQGDGKKTFAMRIEVLEHFLTHFK